MKVSMVHLTAVLGVVLASSARAAETPEREDWSLGVGLGVFSNAPVILGGLGPVGVLGALGTQWSYGVALERRLVGDLWLRARGRLAHSQSDSDTAALETSGLTWSGGLGVRQVFFDVDALSLSGLLMLDAGGASSHATGGAAGFDSTTFGSGLGLAVEYELLRGLHLRLESQIFSVSWMSYELEQVSEAGVSSVAAAGDSFAARLELTPAIELRMSF